MAVLFFYSPKLETTLKGAIYVEKIKRFWMEQLAKHDQDMTKLAKKVPPKVLGKTKLLVAELKSKIIRYAANLEDQTLFQAVGVFLAAFAGRDQDQIRPAQDAVLRLLPVDRAYVIFEAIAHWKAILENSHVAAHLLETVLAELHPANVDEPVRRTRPAMENITKLGQPEE